jgi:hypothetical protein
MCPDSEWFAAPVVVCRQLIGKLRIDWSENWQLKSDPYQGINLLITMLMKAAGRFLTGGTLEAASRYGSAAIDRSVG